MRLAWDVDAPAIAFLLAEAFAEYQPLYTAAGFAATVITPDEVCIRIHEAPVWVAVAEGTIAGTASVITKGESLYIRGMAVLPAARGQRIGELLLTHIETFAAQKQCRHLLLSTTPFLDRAIRLYEHFGFQRTVDGPDDLFGTPLFSMEKVLARS